MRISDLLVSIFFILLLSFPIGMVTISLVISIIDFFSPNLISELFPENFPIMKVGYAVGVPVTAWFFYTDPLKVKGMTSHAEITKRVHKEIFGIILRPFFYLIDFLFPPKKRKVQRKDRRDQRQKRRPNRRGPRGQ